MRVTRPKQRVDGFLHGVRHLESVQHEQSAHKPARNKAHAVHKSVAKVREKMSSLDHTTTVLPARFQRTDAYFFAHAVRLRSRRRRIARPGQIAKCAVARHFHVVSERVAHDIQPRFSGSLLDRLGTQARVQMAVGRVTDGLRTCGWIKRLLVSCLAVVGRVPFSRWNL